MNSMGKRQARPVGWGEGLEDLCEWGTEVQQEFTGGSVCEMYDFYHPLALGRPPGAPLRIHSQAHMDWAP